MLAVSAVMACLAPREPLGERRTASGPRRTMATVVAACRRNSARQW